MIPITAALEATLPGWMATAYKGYIRLISPFGTGYRLSEMEARALLKALPDENPSALVEVFTCTFSQPP